MQFANLRNRILNSAQNHQVSVGQLAGLMAVLSRSVGNRKTLPAVPHMLYEQIRWCKQAPPSHPLCLLEVMVSARSYTENGFKPPPATKRRNADISCLADTGCQACCMGPSHLYKLGMTEEDLLEPALNLKAANTSGIDIVGAVFIEVCGRNSSGDLFRTKQLCYVAKGVEHLLLSKEACQALGIIPSDFPRVGSYGPESTSANILGAQTSQEGDPVILPEVGLDITPCSPDEQGNCECPRRSPAPEPPDFKEGASVEELKSVILKHYASSALNRCTRQTLPLMKGDPMPIITDPAVRPVAIHSPIPVALHWEKQVKADLDRDVALGVIEPVPINTPVSWCSRMIVVPKHDGSPRRTVDLQALNNASVRQTFHTRTPFMLASDVPANTKKTVLDVWNSYHSVPVVEEDMDKLTFLTPWGRYRYRVAPQGYLASGDGYTQRFTEISEAIKDKRTIVDDSVLWSKMGLQGIFHTTCKMLETGHKAGLIFNGDKFQFGLDTVDFAGLEITNNGVRPSRKFLDAIRDFPSPRNISEMRSFFGMINQVCYAFSMSKVMEQFRHFLKPGTQYLWSPELQRGFDLAKEEIVKAVENGVKHFETDRHTCLATDWCKAGIGFFLLQKWCTCEPIHPRCCNEGWKLVLAGGRFTSPAESRYSPVEGECLAVVDALFKARHFISGCSKLTVAVDHLPLVGLLSDRSLADIDNPRLLLLKEKTLWFRFSIIHVPGRNHCGPDYMSRNALDKTGTTKEVRLACISGLAQAGGLECQTSRIEGCLRNATIASVESLQALTFDRIRQEVMQDRDSQDLISAIITTPYDVEFEGKLRPYQKIRHGLHVVDEVPMYGHRVIVPEKLRQAALVSIHGAHQSVGKMYDRAMQSIYWPGLYRDLEELRESCVECTKAAPSQPNLPPHQPASPDYPFQMIAADFYDLKGKTWLVIVDRFSGWISIYYFEKEAPTSKVIEIFKNSFSTFGVAEELATDNDSRFRSHTFQEFLTLWGVKHRVSSDYNPHSNLRAETGVKSAKRILIDNTKSDGSPVWDKVMRAVMQHRNTPLNDIPFSPAQIVFGRPIRDFLPVKPGLFKPHDVWMDNAEKRELAFKKRWNLGLEKWSEKTRPQSQLLPGQSVYVQNQRGVGKAAKRWDRSGIVLESKGFDKYSVKIDGSGRVTDRNRKYLKAFSPDKAVRLRGPSHQGYQNQTGEVLTPSPQTQEVDTGSTMEPGSLNVEPTVGISAPLVPNAPVMNTFPTPTPDAEPSPTVSVGNKRGVAVGGKETQEPELRRSGRVRQSNVCFPEEEYDLS